METISQAKQLLHSCGLKITKPRCAVISTLLKYPHLSADLIHKKVLPNYEGISIQSVYNVLNDCVNVGLVRMISLSGNAKSYEVETKIKHQHLLCRNCGKLLDTYCNLEGIAKEVNSRQSNFTIETVEITFIGICKECKNQ